MRCPRCDYDSLAGSQFCEKCGCNLTGVRVRPNTSYQTHSCQENRTSSVSRPVYDARPTPAQRPVPVGTAMPSSSSVAPIPAPVPVAAPVVPAPAPVPAQPTPAPVVPPVAPKPAAPTLSPEEIARRANAYGALEAKGGQPVFYIDRETASIGRSDDNYVSLEGLRECLSVSRHHARLLCQSEGIFVEDLNSSNGTFVNGKRLIPEVQAQIFDKDEIRFGAAEFIFHWRLKG